MDMAIGARVLGLLDPLYEAALGGSDWAAFLDRLAAEVHGDVGVLAMIGLRATTAEFVAQSNVADEMQRRCAERFLAADPWPVTFRASGYSLGRNGCAQGFAAMREFERGERCEEIRRPKDDMLHTCGGFFGADDAHVGMLATLRSRRQPAFVADDAALMDGVSPHVGKALLLSQRLAHAEQARCNLGAAMDALGDAMFLLDATGRIVCVNRAADAVLVEGGHILSRCGRLMLGSPTNDARLQATIGAVAATTAGVASACPASLSLGVGACATITCFPLPMSHAETTRMTPTARVLVVMTDPGTLPRGLAHLLRMRYKLTPTEALVAEGLAGGESLGHVAQRLRMSKGTARIHLRHVFAKTDTQRQAQLVALIHRVIPTALLLGQEASSMQTA